MSNSTAKNCDLSEENTKKNSLTEDGKDKKSSLTEDGKYKRSSLTEEMTSNARKESQDVKITNISIISRDGASVEVVELGAAEPPTSPPAAMLGIRHLQCLLMFCAILVAYSLRINLSVAIVAMVDKDSANPEYPEYDWDESRQSVILSSFFWGYIVTQFPGGPLAERFGPKLVLGTTLAAASLVSLATPAAAAYGGWTLVCVVRVVLGLCQGVMFPAFHNLLSHWTPTPERGRLVTFVYSGGQFGTITSLPICGLLATSAAGWPSTFYVFGGLGLGWSLLWLALGSNSPAEDRLISVQERAYIEDSLRTSDTCSQKNSTPWRAIMTSLPMWAILAANCGHSWGFWTLMTEMPTYMKTVLGFDLKENGLLSALPYLAMFLLSFVFSWASDLLNKNHVLTLRNSRKFFNTIAQWGPCLALIGLAYARDATVAIALLTIAVGVNSAIYVGFNINHIDLSPNYAGTLVGLTNGVGNIMALIGPLVVGAIVTESGSALQWRIVFFIAAGIYFLSNLAFILFSKSEVQSWNQPIKKKKSQKMNNLSLQIPGLGDVSIKPIAITDGNKT